MEKLLPIRIAFYMFIILTSISFVNSNICSQTEDKIIIQCTIPEKFFLQDFTCLNLNCSDKLINENQILNLYIDNILKTQILRNNLAINNLENDLNIINKICQEKIDNITITKIKNKIKQIETNNHLSISNEKNLVIYNTPENIDKYININNKKKKDIFECNTYNINTSSKNKWIIASKKIKSYCILEYNSEFNCYEYKKQKTKLIFFLITNPTWENLGKLIILLTTIFIIYLIYDTIKYLIKKNEFRTFLKINNNKIKYLIVSSIPLSFIYGKIFNKILFENLNIFINQIISLSLMLLGILFTYFIICLIIFIKNKKKN